MATADSQLEVPRNGLITMMDLIGIGGQVEAESRDHSVQLKVRTDQPGRMIGRKGQTIDAIEHLMNGIHGAEHPRIRITVEGEND
jgi:predicted RNA-binding protein Jag